MADARARRANSWSVTLGVVLIILGVVAMFAPLLATLTLIKMMGWLLILAAIEQGIYAYKVRAEGGFFWKVALAVLYVVVGIMLLRRPVSGAMAAPAILGVLFLLDGIAEIALLARKDDTWVPLAVGDLSLEALVGADAWLIIPGANEGFAAGTPVAAYALRE